MIKTSKTTHDIKLYNNKKLSIMILLIKIDILIEKEILEKYCIIQIVFFNK